MVEAVETPLAPAETAVGIDLGLTSFATLSDGTSYTAQTTLDAKAKNVRVVTENSGHRPVQK